MELVVRELTAEEKAAQKEWEAGAYDREYAEVKQARQNTYQRETDPLYFGWQRGDNTEQEWLDAVQAVKDANPYPVKK